MKSEIRENIFAISSVLVWAKSKRVFYFNGMSSHFLKYEPILRGLLVSIMFKIFAKRFLKFEYDILRFTLAKHIITLCLFCRFRSRESKYVEAKLSID